MKPNKYNMKEVIKRNRIVQEARRKSIERAMKRLNISQESNEKIK